MSDRLEVATSKALGLKHEYEGLQEIEVEILGAFDDSTTNSEAIVAIEAYLSLSKAKDKVWDEWAAARKEANSILLDELDLAELS
jgi:hypothetical protein